MRVYRYKPYILVAGISAALAGCSTMQPSHYAKFTFQGKVSSPDGKPVANAWVKVRGWETLTGPDGRWHQEQIVHCGAMNEHSGGYDESDAILVTAEGFTSAEENFSVKHPGWFQSCNPDQVVAFETVLQPEGMEQGEASEAKKFKPRNPPVVPWPQDRRKAKTPGKGTYSL
jgi:hypothetical protein